MADARDRTFGLIDDTAEVFCKGGVRQQSTANLSSAIGAFPARSVVIPFDASFTGEFS